MHTSVRKDVQSGWTIHPLRSHNQVPFQGSRILPANHEACETAAGTGHPAAVTISIIARYFTELWSSAGGRFISISRATVDISLLLEGRGRSPFSENGEAPGLESIAPS